MTTQNVILVGVDGSGGSNAAIRYAAAEAERSGAGLRLVHVTPDYLPIASVYPLTVPFSERDLEATGNEILADAAKLAGRLLDPSRVTTALVWGERGPSLLEAAEGAALVVLGEDERGLLERIAVGSTVAHVAAHATVPVVAVHVGWMPTARDRVVVGIKCLDPLPVDVLRGALRVASDRKASLEIAFVWEMPGIYDDFLLSAIDFDAMGRQVETDLRAGAASLFAEFPDVRVDVRTGHGQPARVLRDESDRADLLVIARRAHAFPVGHFGSTGRALLRESRCPVEILPVSEAKPTGSDSDRRQRPQE